MNTIAMQPSLSDLYNFVSKVRTYPISVRQVLNLAQQSGQPKKVVDFYKAFPDDQIFKDKDDLATRTEQVGIMRQEETEMPQEEERGPEEY